MTIYPRIVVGTDGSTTATRAVRRAAVLAAALGAPLLVANAYRRTRPADIGPPSVRAQMPGEGWQGQAYRAANAIAQDAAAVAAATAKVRVEARAPEGDAADALVELARQPQGSLLVVGSQGLDAALRALLGNVPNHVLHRAAGDVLVVRTTREPDRDPPRSIVVGTDGSAAASIAVDRAAALAAALGAELTLLSATRDFSAGQAVLDAASARADTLGVAHRADVRAAAPAEALLDAAAEHDLLVVGGGGVSGARRLLGSVANKVSHHVQTDLLVVHTDAAR